MIFLPRASPSGLGVLIDLAIPQSLDSTEIYYNIHKGWSLLPLGGL